MRPPCLHCKRPLSAKRHAFARYHPRCQRRAAWVRNGRLKAPANTGACQECGTSLEGRFQLAQYCRKLCKNRAKYRRRLERSHG